MKRKKMNTYVKLILVMLAFLFIALLSHLFFNTGIMAIVMVSVIWLVQMVSYLQNVVRLKKEKLER